MKPTNGYMTAAQEESPTTAEQIESCATYLYAQFDYQARMEQVHEWMDGDELTKALADAYGGNHAPLNALIEQTAMGLCERSAAAIVRRHGDNWGKFLMEVDYE